MSTMGDSESALSRFFGWITTPGQASATGSGAFLFGGADAAFDVLPHADFLGSSALGAVGGLSVILAAQGISTFRAKARERREADEVKKLRKQVEGLIQLLAEEGYSRDAYVLASVYRRYLHGVVAESELFEWLEVMRDTLRSGRPPR
ncbi:hypothetical protein J3D45_000675 [Microbacterium foliorum]|uniref:hypothetical protein n=1 Tax=Microbacterium foliorum TaxID=104336 RepID=UPI00209F1B7C|nr:hypothetical protein [Microbacterium foliorum]MCP1428177.1 hypothetical protein [Microbacterium foliorum]